MSCFARGSRRAGLLSAAACGLWVLVAPAAATGGGSVRAPAERLSAAALFEQIEDYVLLGRSSTRRGAAAPAAIPRPAAQPSTQRSDSGSRERKVALGGDVRYFQFFSPESSANDSAERGAFRLKLEADLGGRWSFETHGLLQGASPPALGGGFSLAAGRPTRAFDLAHDISSSEDRLIQSDLDRLQLRYDGDHFRVVLGRQAVTWGVNYFWPVLDLFAPFSPERIDRDYKPGVDAARVTIPLGRFSELELLGAVQGEEFEEDRSFGVLGRFHLGRADLGLMIGDFHRDTVIGAFLTGDVAGSLLRAEVAYTETSDRARAGGDPDDFVRATAGLDRLLSPNTTFIFETTWNGYGADDPADYLALAIRERVQRGEITSFGELSSGATLGFQVHPLVSLSAAAIYNWSDHSLLLQPGGSWSLADNGDLLFGVISGIGDDESDRGILASEYGAVAVTVWAALRWAF